MSPYCSIPDKLELRTKKCTAADSIRDGGVDETKVLEASKARSGGGEGGGVFISPGVELLRAGKKEVVKTKKKTLTCNC